jgi:type VI secretion system protein ImpL
MIVASIIAALVVAATWAVVLFLPVPSWVAVVVTLVAVAAVVGLLLWRRHKARAAANEIERTLKSQADAHAETIRPDQQAEIDAMQAEFQKAIAALKGSKLARGGRDALALLPFYMIIGPPGAGKSTALRNSGLQFPYLSARGGGVKGVGGTRNCEWWLTNEAILIDTAGRYTTEEEDRDEWTSFLDLLARTRPKKPINGLIVAVSVGDLGGETEEGAIELAKRIRERMDEVMSRLQMVLPAYLLFTKCDLVPGFVETFGDLRKNERGQIWGFTARLEELGEGTGELFRRRFAELLEVVEARSLARLADERTVRIRERIWRFPQQLAALEANLATFVEHVFAENVYQDTPILRGVYFTSGTQEGRTIDRVLGAMAQAFGVRPALGDEAPVLEAKSYFLRDVFKKVMFPDQSLAVRSAKALKREQVQRWAVGAPALVAALLLFGFPLRAWMLNRSLVQSTGAVVDGVAGILAKAQDTPRLDVLDPLRERLELLQRFEADGAPWSMRFGMYQGSALLPHVRKLYAAAARRLVVEPVFALELEEMDAFLRKSEASIAQPAPADFAQNYDRLKLHLLLSGPRAAGEPRPSEAAQAWLVDRIVERWIGGPKARDPAAGQKVAANAAAFARLLAEDGVQALTRYDDLVRRMRNVLSRVPTVNLAVEKLVREVEPRGLDLTLAAIMGEPIPVLRCDAVIRGAFTRKGYEEHLKARLDDPASVLEPWVLARDSKDQEQRLAEAARQLRSRYFERYVDEWRRFLEATSVDGAAAGGPLQLLRELTRGEPPPYTRLFRAVAYNSRIGGVAGEVAKVGEGLLDRVRSKLAGGGGAASTAAAGAAQALATGEREMGPRDVEKAFAGLAAFAVPQDPGPAAAVAAAAGGGAGPGPQRSAAIDLYVEQLSFVRDALQNTVDGGPAGPLVERVGAARTRIRSLIDGAEVGWRPRLEALLWPPLDAASGDAVKRGAAGASNEWCAAVAKPFGRALGHRYPFNANGEDAALADVVEFFKPAGVVWGFYEQALKTDVQRAGDGFKFAKQLGGQSGFRGDLLVFLARAQDVTRALFPAGSPDPKVELSVRIRPTPGVALVILEVDGQRFEYRNGPEEWYRVIWPLPGKRAGASIRVRAAGGREEVVQQDGEWGLYRLIEAGKLKGEPGIRDFAVAWALPSLGTTVTLDFRPARSESPFFGARRTGKARFLAPFRAGVQPPAVIGRSGGGCN